MKKLLFALTTLFTLLSFAGAGYVLHTGGQASPGFGLIPLLFALTFLAALRSVPRPSGKN